MTEPAKFNHVVSFLRAIADLLNGAFQKSEFQKIILPFTVLRRLDYANIKLGSTLSTCLWLLAKNKHDVCIHSRNRLEKTVTNHGKRTLQYSERKTLCHHSI